MNNRKKQWILAVVLSSMLALVIGCGKKKPPPPPPPPPKPVTATLSANPTSIQRGQSATLTWSTDNATDVTLEGNKVDASGSQTVSPTDTTTYHLSAKGSSGTQDATAAITVTAPPPPPTPTPAPPPPPPATLTVTDIYFDYDKADLRAESQAALSQIAQLMSQNPNWKVKIEGNCDDRGSAMYNLALGERRANAAMQALTQAGVPASQLQAVSYGKEKPVCTDAKEDCWQKNRHDHFALQP